MFIEGPVSVVPNAAAATKEKAFICVENGSTSAIVINALVQWDTTANSAVAGIMQDTLGLRVEVASATAATVSGGSAGFANKAFAATPAGTRGATGLLQVWGHKAVVLADTAAATDIMLRGPVIPSTDAAGKIMGVTTSGGALAPTALECTRIVGIGLAVVAASTTADTTIFVKCI